MSEYHDIHHATPEEQAKVFARAKKLRIAMLTTQGADGTLDARPMTLQAIDDDGTMWFFTSAYTSLDDAIRRQSQVNVAFADTSDSFYLSTSANAAFVDDRARIDELWSPMAAAWFPEGKDDPNLRLLRVDAEKVDYWFSRSGKIVQMLALAKAAARHQPPGPEAGEHGTFEPAAGGHETVTSVGSR